MSGKVTYHERRVLKVELDEGWENKTKIQIQENLLERFDWLENWKYVDSGFEEEGETMIFWLVVEGDKVWTGDGLRIN